MKSKEELKKELHELIDSIENENVLNTLHENVVPYLVKGRNKEMDEEKLEAASGNVAGIDASVIKKKRRASKLRGRLSPMTGEQIDKQSKALRDEWQRDI